MKKLKRKKIYNPESTEEINEAFIFGGSPSGILNFTKPTNQWSFNIWEQMLNNTWFPSEPDLSLDAKNYKLLTNAEKRTYDLALAQLIFNDSEQTNNLIDNINPYITDPIVNACLSRQAFEEALHSQSYAVMVEDVSVNTEEIYNLHKTDKMLAKKNEFIANMYSSLANGDNDEEKMLLAQTANNILEGIVFFGGFTTIWSFGQKMPGSAKMISFICRDEKTHLSLFKNMFRTALRQRPYLKTKELEEKVKNLIKEAVKIEIEWTKYVTNNEILGFSDKAIEVYIKNKGNAISKNLGYDEIYNTEGTSPLLSLEKQYEDPNNIKTNFFEAKVSNYSKGKLDLNF